MARKTNTELHAERIVANEARNKLFEDTFRPAYANRLLALIHAAVVEGNKIGVCTEYLFSETAYDCISIVDVTSYDDMPVSFPINLDAVQFTTNQLRQIDEDMYSVQCGLESQKEARVAAQIKLSKKNAAIAKLTAEELELLGIIPSQF